MCVAHDCGVYVIAITEHLCHQLAHLIQAVWSWPAA
jgi:hypothetical protein